MSSIENSPPNASTARAYCAGHAKPSAVGFKWPPSFDTASSSRAVRCAATTGEHGADGHASAHCGSPRVPPRRAPPRQPRRGNRRPDLLRTARLDAVSVRSPTSSINACSRPISAARLGRSRARIARTCCLLLTAPAEIALARSRISLRWDRPCRRPCSGWRRHRHRSKRAVGRSRRAGRGQGRRAPHPARSRSVRRASCCAVRSSSSALRHGVEAGKEFSELGRTKGLQLAALSVRAEPFEGRQQRLYRAQCMPNHQRDQRQHKTHEQKQGQERQRVRWTRSRRFRCARRSPAAACHNRPVRRVAQIRTFAVQDRAAR